MSDTPDTHELARPLAVLEERMKTNQAEYESALERIAGDHKAALERIECKFAERDRDNTRWQIGLWIAAVVIIGVLIRWPG